MKKDNINLVDHPLMQHYLCTLRNKETLSGEFRRIIDKVSRLLAYEASFDLKTTYEEVETPWEKTKVKNVDESPVIVSIMRAGNGMLDGLLSMLPFASAGHIGIYRDKFIDNTVEYYFRLPEDVASRTVFVADPMIATGDTMLACLERLKQYDVGRIKILSILISSVGAKRILKSHPDVEIVTAGIEEKLDEKGYLIPGIGDVGNRLYAS